MRFLWTSVLVQDMEASLAFYREIVGLPLDRQFAAPDGSAYAFLGEGETKLELIAHPAEQTPVFGGEVSIGFSVDSLEEKLRFVKEKGLSVEGPFAQQWSASSCGTPGTVLCKPNRRIGQKAQLPYGMSALACVGPPFCLRFTMCKAPPRPNPFTPSAA